MVPRGTAVAGSSPLARGALRTNRSKIEAVRLIPAGAGSTSSAEPLRARSRAHPRWRGEHGVHVALAVDLNGSSPLARGALHQRSANLRPGRLIPAGAGSTLHWLYSHAALPAHPRWRGEHPNQNDPTKIDYGSSPLARGARAGMGWSLVVFRLIPAGAGST